MSFFYLAEIELCKIKAEERADDDQAIGDKKLILFSSVTKGFQLVNKNEILAGGKMYDIVKTQKKNGTIIYYAFADKDEDEYIHHLTDLEKNNSGEKSLAGKTIKVFEAKYFTGENSSIAVCQSFDLLNHIRGIEAPFFYKSLLKDIFSPPPNQLLS